MSTLLSNISTTPTNFVKGLEWPGDIQVLYRFHPDCPGLISTGGKKTQRPWALNPLRGRPPIVKVNNQWDTYRPWRSVRWYGVLPEQNFTFAGKKTFTVVFHPEGTNQAKNERINKIWMHSKSVLGAKNFKKFFQNNFGQFLLENCNFRRLKDKKAKTDESGRQILKIEGKNALFALFFTENSITSIPFHIFPDRKWRGLNLGKRGGYEIFSPRLRPPSQRKNCFSFWWGWAIKNV